MQNPPKNNPPSTGNKPTNPLGSGFPGSTQPIMINNAKAGYDQNVSISSQPNSTI
jgi:hypothetical protein